MFTKRVVLLALVAVVLGATPSVQADDKECEVCIKVIEDLKTTYTQLIEENPKGKKQDLAESAVTKLCGKKLNSKDNKLCYNLEPLKKDVARQCVGCVEKSDFIAKIKATEHTEL
ncbi:hypothetical protein BBO99_00001974 [Phytophthora kernoviae]|uniref:Saposin B-type domain-containing protein n=1 Tax=Phytophthora kernoviae TaxID=325452 RepID=A0A3F2RZC3_9STRA|nr:hypothetical protein JM16_001655 [Phytophthora kernoviae]RLN20243.1 hypothetical protein BBI17_001976 [Phytophthora kernoviae]RLN67212.1 hypothetical protein BBP00_00001766 [Phytophthora kernoviae]RLN69656.1 hypothetical protein BBJ29_001305 [Phytophthora kernoviae]RLN83591.1 hypothetical protein BBO99_00001974 [Phytophthora kernoviae]